MYFTRHSFIIHTGYVYAGLLGLWLLSCPCIYISQVNNHPRCHHVCVARIWIRDPCISLDTRLLFARAVFMRACWVSAYCPCKYLIPVAYIYLRGHVYYCQSCCPRVYQRPVCFTRHSFIIARAIFMRACWVSDYCLARVYISRRWIITHGVAFLSSWCPYMNQRPVYFTRHSFIIRGLCLCGHIGSLIIVLPVTWYPSRIFARGHMFNVP